MKCLFVWVCGGALARIFFVGTFEHGKAVISALELWLFDGRGVCPVRGKGGVAK